MGEQRRAAIFIVRDLVANAESPYTPLERLVAFCIGDHIGDKGSAWPSRRAIAEWTGLSETTVRETLTTLCEGAKALFDRAPGALGVGSYTYTLKGEGGRRATGGRAALGGRRAPGGRRATPLAKQRGPAATGTTTERGARGDRGSRGAGGSPGDRGSRGDRGSPRDHRKDQRTNELTDTPPTPPAAAGGNLQVEQLRTHATALGLLHGRKQARVWREQLESGAATLDELVARLEAIAADGQRQQAELHQAAEEDRAARDWVGRHGGEQALVQRARDAGVVASMSSITQWVQGLHAVPLVLGTLVGPLLRELPAPDPLLRELPAPEHVGHSPPGERRRRTACAPLGFGTG